VIQRRIHLLFWTALLVVPQYAAGPSSASPVAFTVSIPRPEAHMIHVRLKCDGLKGEIQDFKLPAWAPGYYRIMDFAKHVSNFRAQDGAGHELPWERSTPNTWRVAAGGASTIVLDYDVSAATAFGANNFVGESRGYISPPGLYMHLAEQIQRSATVTIQLPRNWQHIATGLDPAPGKPDTFTAPDFDVLYDCPALMGNQEMLRFDLKGVPHDVALEDVPAAVDRQKMLADLKRMVEAATELIGDIPYKRYTFLMMGHGNGGIEHLNSASISFNGNSLTNENGYRSWLSYVAHEYFHNFNVKRIRPIALGPFNYDEENLTRLLWVSEGLSVYYEDLVLVRAGLMTRAQYLAKMQNSISRFENASGHHYQSAADASWSTWGTGTSGVGGDKNTTISYYDNGAMLGAMLDLKIRNESKNKNSLDDVMRALYRKYYLQKKRGFTDAEFRAECESAAGADLTEVFDYAYTTKDVDYAKYFAYAGLAVTSERENAPGGYLGLNTQTADGRLMVASVSADSPAEAAGLRTGDHIAEIDGARATVKALSDLLAMKKAGDKISLKVSRNGNVMDLEAELGPNFKRSFVIRVMDKSGDLQNRIWRDWLRGSE
jgi:predicted metalloprotease with PDZ domain